MNMITLSPSVSSTITTTPTAKVSSGSASGKTGSKALNFFMCVSNAPPVPAQATDIDSFIASLCTEDPRLAATLEEGHRWVAKKFYAASNSLQKLRLEAGLSQAALATRMGTSQPYIAKLEAGKIDAGMSKVALLADVLGQPREKVFKMLLDTYERRHEKA